MRRKCLANSQNNKNQLRVAYKKVGQGRRQWEPSYTVSRSVKENKGFSRGSEGAVLFWFFLPSAQEIWVQSLGKEVPLEKGMVTHSSFLGQEIPWTEDPGGLQSMELPELDTAQ